MPQTALPAALLALVVAVAAADDKAKPADAKNLVANGNLEAVAADGKPAKWGLAIVEGGKAEYASRTEKPKEGKRCLHMKGNAEWAVAFSEKVARDKKATYTLTGFARAKAGTAKIKIDYYQGDTYLGMTESDEVSADDWKDLKVVAGTDEFPEATHILACAVGFGEFDAAFDDFVLTAAPGK